MPRHAPPDAPRATHPSRSRTAWPRVAPQSHRLPPHADALRPSDLYAALGPLLTHTRDGVVVGDLESGRVVLWNPDAERLLGWTAVDAIGQRLDRLLSPTIVPLFHACLGLPRSADDGQPEEEAPSFKITAVTCGGAMADVLVKLVPLEYVLAPTRYVLVLVRAAPPRETLVSARDASSADGADPSSASQVTTESSTSVAPSGSYARGDARLDLTCERVNLVPLVSGVVARFRARGLPHKLNMALPQGLTASLDAARIELAVERLLDHTAARCPGGCWIDVDLSRPLTGQARIEIRDFGPVVDDRTRIQLAAGGGDDPTLSLVRQAVELHGGTLSFAFPAVGGVRAIVTLPTQRGRTIASRP